MPDLFRVSDLTDCVALTSGEIPGEGNSCLTIALSLPFERAPTMYLRPHVPQRRNACDEPKEALGDGSLCFSSLIFKAFISLADSTTAAYPKEHSTRL